MTGKKSQLYLGEEGSPYAGGSLLHNILLFGRLCRALGMDITPNRMTEVARAIEFIRIGQKQDVYHTLRALMVTRQRDLELFEQAFKLFWQRPTEEWSTLNLSSLGERRHQKKTQFLPPLESEPDDEASDSKTPHDPNLIAIVPTVSTEEVLRHKDFADMTGEEVAAAQRMMAQLKWSLGVRTTRRFHPGKGQQVDLRRSIRYNIRYEGEMLHMMERAPKIKPRPLILLCDVSGSMERYTRLLLHFVHALAHSIFQVESFVFSTRLTRITLPVRRRSIDAALRDVGTAVNHWGSGTRIDHALHTFNYFWSRRVLGQGAVVLLISDGWDRGEPEELAKEAARLQRSCYRFIWLNPLLSAPQYEPLTRGAQALLPFVDDFLPVSNLANLEMLARELGRVDWRRPERAPHTHLIVKKQVT
ncbi:MAG: VWA domain-containing protein [Anaerolineae bacterium]